MVAPRLRSLTVCGFRAYGRSPQTLNLPSDIAAVWGPNSKGKSSLAEALEFLLTGRISRRELMAGSQDEFAEALRNVHLGETDATYVAAKILAADGKEREVRRTLKRDYAKREDCQSQLEIDGVVSDASGLASLGIVLSQPPLQAPVLAQHTLGYLFSAGPQERATYFKTLLELNDLETFRSEVAAAMGELREPAAPALSKLAACSGIVPIQGELRKLPPGAPDLPAITSVLEGAAAVLLSAAGQPAEGTLAERTERVRSVLAKRRGSAFPLDLFSRTEPAAWSAPAPEAWARLRTYLDERGKVDAEVARLVTLFEQALQLPQVAGAKGTLDCPLCATKASLTPDRIAFLRERVQQTRSFAAAEGAARSTLQQLLASAQACAATAKNARPALAALEGSERRRRGFSLARIREILGNVAEPLLSPWLKCLRSLLRAVAALGAKAEEVVTLAQGMVSSLASFESLEAVIPAYAELQRRRDAVVEASRAYEVHARGLRSALEGVVDARADTRGWQDFIDLALDVGGLHAAMVERTALQSVTKEMEKALREIDAAKERVLDEKFGEYSDLVREWWDRLRPGEPAFFSTVRPRKGAKRTIDIKAELSPHEDRSAPKVRDAVAVFSQSQMHCLGLALFLARAQREGLGFIVLDEPVLSSDEDYRVHFHADVLEALLAIPMQVVVLTQSQPTWEELESRYRHANISQAQLRVETAAEGCIIEATSDGLRAKIGRARSLARTGHPDNMKSGAGHLRDAAERFCKELLVEDRRSQGDGAVEIAEYDGHALEWLAPKVAPMLRKDPSHAGKFEALKKLLNPRCHDNAPPSTQELVHACGELDRFVKDYLGR
ncbi:MAG TPA: ATP-binding protein [Planctomycetota bacterium]|nr:ATP-binding protein [Planctomycetota bacterium]